MSRVVICYEIDATAEVTKIGSNNTTEIDSQLLPANLLTFSKKERKQQTMQQVDVEKSLFPSTSGADVSHLL